VLLLRHNPTRTLYNRHGSSFTHVSLGRGYDWVVMRRGGGWFYSRQKEVADSFFSRSYLRTSVKLQDYSLEMIQNRSAIDCLRYCARVEWDFKTIPPTRARLMLPRTLYIAKLKILIGDRIWLTK